VSDTRAAFGGNSRQNQFLGGFAAFNAVPIGYRPPYAFVIARQDGGLAASKTITGAGDVDFANLAGGLNGEAALIGAGDITNAALALVVSAVAALAGAGSITGDIVGKLEAAAALAGSGDITAALGALADLSASVSGTATVDASAVAKGFISADIVVTGDLLTAGGVAAAVWAALAAENNAGGTMGEKLNDAGSAANPWTEVIESGYTAAELLRLIAALGAAKASGGGTTSIAVRDLGDTKNRAVLTVDENGNRSAVALDLA
jgi:hypothetical protein